MVTFGLWRSDFPGDDQVGSVLAQAGTVMHELGHNLDLAHGGLSTQPNCMPNYQSVMNYLYQTRGLTDAAGEHVDYSFGTLLGGTTLSESSLPTGALANQQYAIRFFGPVGPSTPPRGSVLGNPYQRITSLPRMSLSLQSPGPMEVREERYASVPEWAVGGADS